MEKPGPGGTHLPPSGPPPPGFAPPPYTTHQAGPAGAFHSVPVQPVVAPAMVYVNSNFGPDTQQMTCPHCHSSISTRVESGPTMKTHLFALILCLTFLWCCAPCPYCIDSCLVKKHYCPACNQYLGQHEG